MARRNRRIQFGILIAGITVLVGIGIGGALMRPGLEPDRIVETRFGDVRWNHEQHARMQDIASCQVCHHKERQGTANPRPCGECHEPETNQEAVVLADLHRPAVPELETATVAAAEDGTEPAAEGNAETTTAADDDENAPPAMTAYHGRCIGCHQAMKAGPVGCRDCHAQKFSGEHGVVTWDHQLHARRLDMRTPDSGDDNCIRCHHQDKNAETEADYRACNACHEPADEMGLAVATGLAKHETAKHFECERCHVVTNPEAGLRTCKDCHPAWNVDTEKVRPAIEQAVHQRCQECHNPDYPELTAAMPARCEDCHRPDPAVLADLGVGMVLWDHDRHARYGGEGMTCSKCHHTDQADQPHMRCSRCHGTGLYENPSVAEALRKRCLGCHQEKENGLVAWDAVDTDREQVDRYEYAMPDGRTFRWSHREHAVAYSFSCRNCHHGLLKENGEYLTGAKAEVAWTGSATHVQSCRACHGEDGPVAGSPAAGTKAPKLHDAMTTVCLECHVRLGGGPQTWEDYFKVEPVESPAAPEMTAAPDTSGETAN